MVITALYPRFSSLSIQVMRPVRNLVDSTAQGDAALEEDEMARTESHIALTGTTPPPMNANPDDLAAAWEGSTGPPLWLGETCWEAFCRFPFAFASGDGRRMWFPAAFARGLACRADYVFVGQLCLVLGADWLFGLLVATKTTLPGWQIAGALAALFFGTAAFAGYLATREWHASSLTALVCAVAAHIWTHVSYFDRVEEGGVDITSGPNTNSTGIELGVYVSAFFWPAAAAFAMGVWRLRLDNYTLHTVSVASFVVCEALTAAMALVLIFSSEYETRAALAIGVSAFNAFVVTTLVTVAFYARNGFRNSVYTSISFTCIAVCVGGAGVAAGATLDGRFYEGFSVSWACLLVVVYLAAGMAIPVHADDKLVDYVHASGTLLPGWVLHSDCNDVLPCSLSQLLQFFSFGGAMLWAMLATSFLPVATYGLGVMTFAQWVFFVVFMENYRNHTARFGEALVQLTRRNFGPMELMRVAESARRQAKELEVLEVRRRAYAAEQALKTAQNGGEEGDSRVTVLGADVDGSYPLWPVTVDTAPNLHST